MSVTIFMIQVNIFRNCDNCIYYIHIACFYVFYFIFFTYNVYVLLTVNTFPMGHVVHPDIQDLFTMQLSP